MIGGSEESSVLTTDNSEVEDELLFQQANDYDHMQEYQFGQYVDARDSVGKWCAGQIVEYDEDKKLVRVHFDGWSEKYDEYISLLSPKIAPFRFTTT